MVSFCVNCSDCRREMLLHYFGEKFPAEMCGGTCDNCERTGPVVEEDYTREAGLVLKLVAESCRAGKKGPVATFSKLCKLLSGSKDKEVTIHATLCSPPLVAYYLSPLYLLLEREVRRDCTTRWSQHQDQNLQEQRNVRAAADEARTGGLPGRGVGAEHNGILQRPPRGEATHRVQ